MHVELIVENAAVHTGDADGGRTSAFAVADGRIVALGDDARGLRADERIDVGGRAVLPGFNDVHAHSVWFGTTLLEVGLATAASIDDVYARIERAAAAAAADEWVIASGFNPLLLQGALPDRDVLDRVAGGRPVWIKHASGHACQLNGVGLRRVGIAEDFDTPIDGGVVVVDPRGRPTGLLEETAMSLVRDRLMPYATETIERALELATAQYAREGLTSVTDAGVAGGWIGHAPGELAAYQNVRDAGRLRTRMQVMPEINALAPLRGHEDDGARLGFGAGMRTGWGDDRLQLGPVKIFVDGSLIGRTAYMSEDFDGCPGNHGYLQQDPESLRGRVMQAAAAGWSLALHASGDAGLDLALDLLDEAISRYGRRAVPHRVEHGLVVRPEQLARLAGLGVVCTIQPRFLQEFGDGISEVIGEARVRHSMPAREMLDSRQILALSSDRPVVSDGAPLRGIQGFVQRLTQSGRPFAPHQRITAAEAVHAATAGSAAATGQAGRKGRLVPGQLADFVVLEEHPADVPSAEIHAIPVLATAVGGEFTHRESHL